MSTYRIEESTLIGIADSIRNITGKTGEINVTDISTEITAIGESSVELPTLTNEGSASDLLSGKQLIDQEGNVVTGTIATKTASNLTASGATVTVPAGYYASQATKSVSTATQATPSITINASGLITATATQTAGYVVAGSKSATKQLAFQAAKTITPTTTSQTAVSSGYYTGGAVTVAAVPTQSKTVTPTSTTQNITPDSGKFLSKVTVNGDSNLVAGNIKSGISIFGVNGNYVGSGSGGSGDTSIEDAFVTNTLTNYTNDRVTSIGNHAFDFCSSLTTVSFPVCTNIGSSAFYSCISLTSVSFPVCTSIGSWAFEYCSSLTSVSFPACTNIDLYAFGWCSSLTSISFPVCTSIGNSAFYSCTSLTSVNFPKCTNIGSNAFAYCSSLTSVSFPVCTNISDYGFIRCTSLTSVSFPKCTSIGANAFAYCSSLTSASFTKCTSIGSYAFNKCYNLISLYLTGSSLCTLSNSNAFTSTPIGGYSTSAGRYGSIYVKSSLLTSYKNATNWTYFSSRFVGV